MPTRLIYANTNNRDMFYAVRDFVSDAFFYLEHDGKKMVFLDKREFDVFKEHDKEGKFEVIPLEPLLEEAGKLKDVYPSAARFGLTILRKYVADLVELEVPAHLPLDIADALRANGVKLIVKNPFFPERAIKTTVEVGEIEDAIKRTTNVYKFIEKVLKESSIDNDKIIYRGNILTSEYIKTEADRILLELDMVNTEGIIIASGNQAAIPHHLGGGPLLPNQPIICDIFPVKRSTGYFADMTRTYVKGKASEEMKKIYDTVKESQEVGIAMTKPGAKLVDVHKACSEVFLKAGYDVGEKGFIHGTGHGLGLDIHEPPSLSPKGEDGVLKEGHVITVEPGLYYPNRGSVRIEDVVVVTAIGCRNLTNYPKVLEIP